MDSSTKKLRRFYPFLLVALCLAGCGPLSEQPVGDRQVLVYTEEVTTFYYDDHRYIIFHRLSAGPVHDPKCEGATAPETGNLRTDGSADVELTQKEALRQQKKEVEND